MSVTCHNCDRPAGDNALLCTTCADALTADLRAIPGLVDDMTITRARLDRMSRGRLGGKSADTALPVRLDKYDQRPTERPLDRLNSSVLGWARALADHLAVDLWDILGAPGLRVITGYARGGRRADNATVSTEAFLALELCAIWMAHNPNALRHHPAADELFDEITDVVADARKAVDRLPELSYKGTCEQLEHNHGVERYCGADLYVERGAQWARCPNCQTQHLVRDLDTKILARMHDMNYTLAELNALLPQLGKRTIKPGTLRSWASRNRLVTRGWRHNGRITDRWIHRNDPPVYRLGDILALTDSPE